jgi:RNA polymerase sigma-70 factor (ECF subfamily)
LPNPIAEIQVCLERLRSGEADARGALIVCAYEHLRGIAGRQMRAFNRVRRFADIEDILQNVYLRLARRLISDAPNDAAEFFSWASREIRCELLDLIRRHFGAHGDGQQINLDPKSGSRIDPAESTHNPAVLARWREFHDQIERLPVAERCVFDLRWYQDMTWSEAAAVLNMSESSVKRHWVNARIRLQSVLKLDGRF